MPAVGLLSATVTSLGQIAGNHKNSRVSRVARRFFCPVSGFSTEKCPNNIFLDPCMLPTPLVSGILDTRIQNYCNSVVGNKFFLLDYCVSGVQGEDSSRGSENKKCFKLYVLYYLIENILKLMNRTTGAKGNNCFASHETFVKIPA